MPEASKAKYANISTNIEYSTVLYQDKALNKNQFP